MLYVYTDLVELSKDIKHVLSRDILLDIPGQQTRLNYDDRFLTQTKYYGVAKVGDTEARLIDMVYGIHTLVVGPGALGLVRVDDNMLVECILLVFLERAYARENTSFHRDRLIDNSVPIPNNLVGRLWNIVFGRMPVEKSVSVLEQVMDHGNVSDGRTTALPSEFVAEFKQSAAAAFGEYATVHFVFPTAGVSSAPDIADRVLNIDILDRIAALLDERLVSIAPLLTAAALSDAGHTQLMQADDESGRGYQRLVRDLETTARRCIGAYNTHFGDFVTNYTGHSPHPALASVEDCVTAIAQIGRESAVLTAYIGAASNSDRAMIVVKRLVNKLGARSARYALRRDLLARQAKRPRQISDSGVEACMSCGEVVQ